MACIAPRDVGKLVLASPAGLWLPEHPLPDLFALLPRAKLAVLPEAGHMVPYEQPEAFAAAVVDFLAA